MYDFKMPSLGADMEDGILLEWRVKPGDKVKKGDIIALIDTVKAAIEIEIFVDGTIDKILVTPDPKKKIPVGTVLALVRAEGAVPEELSPPSTPEPSTQAKPFVPPVEIATTTKEILVRVSPAARKKAMELGIDLAAVKGTGPDNAITITDVENAKTTVAAESEKKPSGFDKKITMRKGIAAAMTRSWKEIPHYFLRSEVDMTNSMARLAKENESRAIEDRMLTAAFFLKATAIALTEASEFNGFYVNGEFQKGNGIHIGFAIALREGGLIAPAIRECDKKNLETLMKNVNDLVERTRSLNLKSSEMTDATITISSLGDLGATTVFGIIYPPQVALVGFGSIMEKAVSIDGNITSRQMMDLTLSGDHRQTDGRQGALFLSTIKEILENPAELFGDE